MVFHWSLSDSEFPQVSWTHLSILALLNNVVVWMVSTHLPTFKSSSPFSNHLVTVPNIPVTIGIIVTFIFHSFFNSLARSRYLSLFSHFFSFILWSAETAKSTILQVLFFLLIIIRSGHLAEIRWSTCTSKSHRSLCVLFSWTGAGLCIDHLLVWSNLDSLHIFQWITLPTQSCLVLYSLCTNLLHSLIMWLMVSSLSPHCLHLLFCRVLSILTLIWLVLMALFCTAIIIIIIIIYSIRVFPISVSWWFFTGVCDSKSPQVSRTCLRILAIFSNAVIWIVSTHPPTSKSFRPFNNPLVILPKAPITIGTIVTFMSTAFSIP